MASPTIPTSIASRGPAGAYPARVAMSMSTPPNTRPTGPEIEFAMFARPM
jgi:hypothetical protein